MILVKKPTVNRKSSKGNDSNGLTINNLNKFVVRYFDRLSTGTLKIKNFATGAAQALSGLKPNPDLVVSSVER